MAWILNHIPGTNSLATTSRMSIPFILLRKLPGSTITGSEKEEIQLVSLQYN